MSKRRFVIVVELNLTGVPNKSVARNLDGYFVRDGPLITHTFEAADLRTSTTRASHRSIRSIHIFFRPKRALYDVTSS